MDLVVKNLQIFFSLLNKKKSEHVSDNKTSLYRQKKNCVLQNVVNVENIKKKLGRVKKKLYTELKIKDEKKHWKTKRLWLFVYTCNVSLFSFGFYQA